MNEGKIRKLIKEAVSDAMGIARTWNRLRETIEFATILALDKVKDDIVKKAQQDLIKKIEDNIDKDSCIDGFVIVNIFDWNKIKAEVKR